jgi:hypothetical protein
MSARYLLRLDDACPTMDGDKWRRIEALFYSLGIKPIVGIIPDNRDSDLHYAPPDRDFWMRARSWQDNGWTIALHGYQHLLRPCRAKHFLPFHARSEFAGLSFDQQAEKIRQGWILLKSQGLNPTVWVAPAHSFDATTLEALARETPIRTISDGVAQDQYFEYGFNWIPQQLWSFVPKREGLWTVCLHPNTMSETDFRSLEDSLRSLHANAIASVEQLKLTGRPRSFGDRMEAAHFWRRHYVQRGTEMIKKIVRP